jgi:5-methylcytosine-specific restriction endonuclease McrA
VALVRGAKWNNANPEKRKTSYKRYRLNNLEERRAVGRDWYAHNRQKVAKHKTKHRKHIAARNAQWFQKNKEHRRVIAAQWRAKNKALVAHYARTRRARHNNQFGDVSKNIIAILLRSQKRLCPCCLRLLNNDYELDHVIPLSRGGRHDDHNLQLVHLSCNRKKSSKTMKEFLRDLAA